MLFAVITTATIAARTPQKTKEAVNIGLYHPFSTFYRLRSPDFRFPPSITNLLR